MPTTKQQQSFQDSKELTLGALFLLDHAPEPAKDMEWHEYSEWAITEHLSRHSYYYQPNSKRTLVTAPRMRKRILEMCKCNAKNPIQQRRYGFRDKVAFVFEHGGTGLLKEDFLKREGYNKNTFSESRLSKHVSERDAPADVETNGTPEGEEAEEVDSNDTSRTGRHVLGGQGRGSSEVAPPSKQPTLPSASRHVSAPLQASKVSRTGLKLKLRNRHERHEQNGANRDEQLQPSGHERRKLRSSDSIGPQTQTLRADKDTLCVSEEVDDASSWNNPGPHDEIESIPGAKRRPTQDQGPHKRQCQVNHATHKGDSRSSEAQQNTVASREKQPEPQLAILNLDEQGWNMEKLYTDILGATDVVLASIGHIRNIASPLQPDASGPLRDLYVRCWGPRWRQVCARQIDQRFFRMPQVTTSVLSAFLCEKVLTQRARLEELVGNVVKIGGSLGEALLEEVDVSTRETTITKRARMIEAYKACSRLAQDSETLQQELNLEADSLAKDASTTMAPHLAVLSCIAKHHLLSSGRPETDTLKVLESAFAKVIHRALHYRLQLLATGCEYTLTWPGPDDVFDSRNMRIDGGVSENDNDQSIVLFTVFPGLEIKPMSSSEMEPLPDAKAMVMVQRSEDRS